MNTANLKIIKPSNLCSIYITDKKKHYYDHYEKNVWISIYKGEFKTIATDCNPGLMPILSVERKLFDTGNEAVKYIEILETVYSINPSDIKLDLDVLKDNGLIK